KDRMNDCQALAAAALGRFGERARGAIPFLLGTLRDKEFASAEALARIDPSNLTGVSFLCKGLEASDEKARETAAHQLHDLGRLAKGAVPDLVKAAKEDRPFRLHVLWALLTIDPENPDAREGFIDELKHPDDVRRENAARWVGGFKRAAWFALPTLLERL